MKNKQAEGNAHTCLYLAMEKHPDFLMGCLNSSETEVSYSALSFMHSLSRDSLVDIIYSSGTTTNEHWYVMKKIRESENTLLQPAVPILVKRLQDEHLETRQLATNVLLELNPKAAKQAGVRVVMPYLYYAN